MILRTVLGHAYFTRKLFKINLDYVLGLNFLYNLYITINIIRTKNAARIGAKIDAVVTTAAVPVSTRPITGLAVPPVVAVEANLPVAEAPFIAVAVPPPAIIAKVQVITGSKLEAVDTITAVPAKAAIGIAKLSNKLSNQGIKYAKISTIVATPKVIKAAILPTHSQFSFNCHTPK